jgi:hypothetical protein
MEVEGDDDGKVRASFGRCVWNVGLQTLPLSATAPACTCTCLAVGTMRMPQLRKTRCQSEQAWKIRL